jgi:hypothetical protein
MLSGTLLPVPLQMRVEGPRLASRGGTFPPRPTLLEKRGGQPECLTCGTCP